ncbi:hypothetical protein H8356DRAFT_1322504 [Neocallimastix lanati (nom. inval.)]|nr:hypothetical protein H8356DRAFT_1322504 [Neocallimastix sp. JGI-2020a]
MDENQKIEFSETNRGKEQVIINRKSKFNFSTLKKNNSKENTPHYKMNNCEMHYPLKFYINL